MNTINICPQDGYPQLVKAIEDKKGFILNIKSYDAINGGDILQHTYQVFNQETKEYDTKVYWNYGTVVQIKEQRPARGVYEGKDRPTFYQVITKI